MWVKICANTNIDDALTAANAGADAVGFVFAPSKRRVSIEQVREITARLPSTVETVGVFATGDPFEIKHHVRSSGLSAAQLHRPFDVGVVQTLSREFGSELKIIQTVPYAVDAGDQTASDAEFVATLLAVSAEPAVWAILIDAQKSGQTGGLGLAFDWAHVGSLVRTATAIKAIRPLRVILAGGLRPDTVGRAVTEFQPWGVDVASGVEASAGKKNPALVEAFVSAVRP